MKGHESFHAWRASTCHGCGGRIPKGENVWSPGKRGKLHTGMSAGLFHIHCQPAVTVRQMSDEERELMLERAERRKVSAYR